MAYIHRLRYRNLHEMHNEIGNIVIRDPQKSDGNGNGNGGGNRSSNSKSATKTSAASNPVTTEDANDRVSNVVSVVFVTASPTFTGEVAGYVTLTQPTPESSPEPSPEPSPQPPVTYIVDEPQNNEPSSTQVAWTPAGSTVEPAETATQAPLSTNFEPATTYVPSPASSPVTAVVAASSETPSSSLPISVAMAVSSSTLLSSYLPRSSGVAASRSLSSMTPSSTAAAAAAATSSESMTAGGKAGLAIGIIAIIGMIAGAALWLIWKKKKSNEWQKTDDEKAGFDGVFGAMADKRQSAKPSAAQSEHQDASAPHLSLRPVTQFTPDLVGAKKRLSQGNPLDKANQPTGMAAAGASRNLTRENPSGSPWERRPGGETAANPFKDPVNPFGDQGKVAATPPPPNVTVTPPKSEDGPASAAGAAVAVGAAVGAVGAAGVATAAAAGKNGNGQPKNRPGSPAGAPIPAGGPPPGNVYRVQIDFKPSMEDELELSSGQLVRLLHEYDDGWVCWNSLYGLAHLLTYFIRLFVSVLIVLNKVLPLEPVFPHVPSNPVQPTVLLEWVQTVDR